MDPRFLVFAINDARDILFRSKGVERGEDMPTRGVREYALPLYVTHAHRTVCLSLMAA